MKNLLFVVSAILLLLLSYMHGCAHKKPKWLVEASIQDVVNHTLLEKAGVKVVKLPERAYDQELYPYIQQFINDAKEHGVLIPSETSDRLRQVVYTDELSMKGGARVMATCNRYYSTQKTLGGSKKLHWMTIEVLRKETAEYVGTGSNKIILLRELMYHELFHCLFNKGHLPDGMSGIMSPTFKQGSKRAFTHWKQLVKDMFSAEFFKKIPNVG